MAVLQHGVKGDAVVLLGQVLAADYRHEAVVKLRAIDAVMILAPGKAAGVQVGDRLVGGTVPADELQRIAPHEAARRVGWAWLGGGM